MESLAVVLDRHHDLPGESGLSPYQILFGRERSLGNLPYSTPRECEDGQAFFARMEEIDVKVARMVNETHDRRADQINADRELPELFDVGD